MGAQAQILDETAELCYTMNNEPDYNTKYEDSKMKKLTDRLKPNVLIILGALMFIYFLNYVSGRGTVLALGIVAIIVSAYYLIVGVSLVVSGDKISPKVRKVLGLISVTLFAAFTFVCLVLAIVNAADFMGPTAWVINIFGMAAALALIVVFIVSEFSTEPSVFRFTYLSSLVFVITLMLNILFDSAGNSVTLGNIDVLLVVIYALYSFYLFGSIGKADGSCVCKKDSAHKEADSEETSEISE